MACGGPFSPVMTMAAAGLLPGASSVVGAALGPAGALTDALGDFNGLSITEQFSDIVTDATNLLSPDVLTDLRTLASDTFPALTNAIPGDFVSSLAEIAPGGVFDGGFTGLISETAAGLMGQGDLSIFTQIFSTAQGFIGQTNQLLNSALNINDLAATFGPLTGGMDNLMTGSISQISEAFGTLGDDLLDLGNLINMDNLANLGSPAALVQQLVDVGGLVPGVEQALRTAGLDSSVITNITGGQFADISDSANKLLYDSLTEITGSDLAQVKAVLGVTTPGIDTMADLLNPAKILPNSYLALTTSTPDGLRGIYASTNTVNSNIEKFFQDPNAPVYTGEDPIIRARLGLPPLEASV